MKFPKIITRRRAKWTGLAATLLLAAAMVASYWYWPSVVFARVKSSRIWIVGVSPGALTVHWIQNKDQEVIKSIYVWDLESRAESHRPRYAAPQAFFSLPSFNFDTQSARPFPRISIPLWMPLFLCAVPTGILVYRDRKPKPGHCKKCRYDLAGLEGRVCPECGRAAE